MVNEALARDYWPGESPVGKVWPLINRTIVGVAGNIRHSSLTSAPKPELYLPPPQSPGMSRSALVIRTMADPETMVASVQRKIHNAYPDQPLVEMKTMHRLVAESVSQPRFYTVLLGLFAGLALVLAAVGVYGVMSYSVSCRTHEIGIRLAVGASAEHILRMVLRQGGWLVLTGIGIGIAAAAALTRLLASMLFELTPTDVPTFGAVSLLLFLIALVACYIPARRAARVDPLLALRHE